MLFVLVHVLEELKQPHITPFSYIYISEHLFPQDLDVCGSSRRSLLASMSVIILTLTMPMHLLPMQQENVLLLYCVTSDQSNYVGEETDTTRINKF